MKKLLFPFILFGIILLSLNSCHKYPKDIPDWLKEKIKGLEKETRWHKGCLNDHCMVIKELELDGETIYFFDDGTVNLYGSFYTVYDYNGDIVCVWQTTNPSPSCPPYGSAHYIRLIWSEKD